MEKTGALPTAASTSAIGDAFRLDINALRALSVVAVVGFHFQIPGFAGGFVGVDVFLVITGYLMTAKVLNELKLGRFSPWTFWMMRMRRIYPALAVLTVASVIAGWFVTLPAEYTRHLLQALSALTLLSNFAFKSDSGYFAMAAQTKPLLHTWSLSLEWQFYFFMPLIVAWSGGLLCAPCQGSMRWSLRCRSSRPCHWRGVCGQASKMRRDRPSSPCRREPGSRWPAD